VWQSVAVCFGVFTVCLQCDYSVLQCVGGHGPAAVCSLLQCVVGGHGPTTVCIVLHCVAVCLQCVHSVFTVCYSV